jgi:hypothetical protein
MNDVDPSLDKVAARTKLGRGTVQRIRDGEAATRISSLHTLAEAFKLEVWQLLVPDLDPAALPHLVRPGSMEDRLARLESLMASDTSDKPHALAA